MFDDKLLDNCPLCNKEWYNKYNTLAPSHATYKNRSTKYWWYCHFCRVEICFWDEDNSFSLDRRNYNVQRTFFNTIQQLQKYIKLKVLW